MKKNLLKIIAITFISLIVAYGVYFIINTYQEQREETLRMIDDQKRLLDEYKLKNSETSESLKTQIDISDKKINATLKNPTNIPQQKTVDASLIKEDIPTLVKKWSKKVAYLECSPFYKDYKTTGTATIIGGGKSVVALTNAHVITDENSYAVESCDLLINNEKIYTVLNKPGDVKMSASQTQDWGSINLPYDEYLDSIVKEEIYRCDDVNIGDKLIILGYPGIGSHTGLTVTEGIISGLDGNYYVTSAKIDHGNSGGTALRLKDGCYLGIPTSSSVGKIESLGRILKTSVFLKN